jgi:hypothetical protein
MSSLEAFMTGCSDKVTLGEEHLAKQKSGIGSSINRVLRRGSGDDFNDGKVLFSSKSVHERPNLEGCMTR